MDHAPAQGRGPLGRLLDAAGGDLLALLAPPGDALGLPPAADRTAWGADALDGPSVTALIDRCAADRGTPWPAPLASAAARVHRDGDRAGWERPALDRQRRLSRVAVAAAVTLEDAWLDEVADGVQLLCEQTSWCWPAHEPSTSALGPVLPDGARPGLDLGAAEVVGQLAWLDQLLGRELDARYPGLRARVRREARRRVLTPFLGPGQERWRPAAGPVNNWNPWVHGHVLVAALRLLDGDGDAVLRAGVVERVVSGLDGWVAALPQDGAVDEGPDYWWAGACRALEAVDVLAHATGGAVDALPAVPPLRATVRYPHQLDLGGGWRLAVGDGRARGGPAQPWHELHRAARRVGDADAVAYAASLRGVPLDEAAGLGRLLRGLTDGAWRRATPTAPPLPGDVWLPSRQIMVAREVGGSRRGLTVTAKGGHNGESHNHDDVGSFTVSSDGVPVVVDAGRPTYTAQTFGPGRRDLWAVQSAWHTVPEIAGATQAPGADAAAREVAHQADEERSTLTLDLAGAYRVPGLRGWRRTVTLDRVRRRVAVHDAWDLADGAPAVVRLLLAGTVRVAAGCARVSPVRTAPDLLVTWPVDVPFELVRRELDDPVLADVWGPALHRLDLAAGARSALTVVVEQVGATNTLED